MTFVGTVSISYSTVTYHPSAAQPSLCRAARTRAFRNALYKLLSRPTRLRYYSIHPYFRAFLARRLPARASLFDLSFFLSAPAILH